MLALLQTLVDLQCMKGSEIVICAAGSLKIIRYMNEQDAFKRIVPTMSYMFLDQCKAIPDCCFADLVFRTGWRGASQAFDIL